MIFQGELLDKVLSGEKTVTRRVCVGNQNSPWYVVKCRFAPGRSAAAQRGRGVPREANILIRGVERQTLGDLIHASLDVADREAQLEGFANLTEFAAAWKEINGAGMWRSEIHVWRIEFRVQELVALPVAS